MQPSNQKPATVLEWLSNKNPNIRPVLESGAAFYGFTVEEYAEHYARLLVNEQTLTLEQAEEIAGEIPQDVPSFTVEGIRRINRRDFTDWLAAA